MDIRPEPTSVCLPPEQPVGTPANLTALFLLLAAGLMIGTILNHKEPVYGANDASRWNTVYYLVEHGTYEYLPKHGAWWGHPDPTLPRQIPPFATIDMIRIPDAQGGDRYYSSKPPLLPTVLAGVVLLIEKLSLGHADFRQNPWFIIRTTLILVQVVPLLAAFWLIRRDVLRGRDTPFAHAFSLAAIALGTYLTAYAVTLNNHVIAAATGMFAAHAMIRIWYDERRGRHWYAITGFFGAFTAAVELPAGLLLAGLFLLMLIRDWRRTLIAALPAALLPTVVALYTNYLVTGSIWPAYTEVFKPGGWYDFPGSYWSQPSGIDAAQESKLAYLTHMLIGHHGFFSLTPILLICLLGMIREMMRPADGRRCLASVTLLLTAVVAAVYVYTTNNYGGLCEGFRWLFWVVPLWLLFVAEGADLLGRNRLGRLVCYAFLAVSVLSMADALPRPWAQSWLHRLFLQYQWVNY